MKLVKSLGIACAVAWLLLPSPAWAYLDPSTGSLALQIAAGGLLAALATARLYWGRIRSLFRGKPGRHEQ